MLRTSPVLLAFGPSAVRPRDKPHSRLFIRQIDRLIWLSAPPRKIMNSARSKSGAVQGSPTALVVFDQFSRLIALHVGFHCFRNFG